MEKPGRIHSFNGLTERIYRDYLMKGARTRRLVLSAQLAILVLFLGLWEIAGRYKWIDVLLFSYPSKILNLLFEKLADGSVLPHIGVTVMETAIGFILGTVCGTGLAVLIWWSPFLQKVLDPYIVVFNSMPKVALGPLFIVGLGPGMMSIIGITLAITVVITTLVVYSSFNEVDANYVKVVRVFGGNRRDVFRYISRFVSRYYFHVEGQRRTVLDRRYRRRVSRIQARARIFNHIRLSSFQLYACDHELVHHRDICDRDVSSGRICGAEANAQVRHGRTPSFSREVSIRVRRRLQAPRRPPPSC